MEQSQLHGDNQQESMLWWLGGIIDGEGCITINHHRLHRGNPRETLLFSPIIIITNTSKLLIDSCIATLRSFGIPHYIAYYQSKPNVNRKECWQINITGIKRCINALNKLIPYLISKKETAKLVKEFCERRLHENKGNNKQREYQERDFEIIVKVAEIHNRNPQRLYAEIRAYQERNKI